MLIDPSYIGDVLMISKIAEQVAEVRILRHSAEAQCDVVVAVGGKEMSLRCRDYNQAVKWARLECKSYKIEGGFTVERLDNHSFSKT